MLTAKEKVEDMVYLSWLLEALSRELWVPSVARDTAVVDTPRALELQAEIDKVKHKIATHNYAFLEKRRQASIARLGKESMYW